jgi:hypothetical protein
MKKVRLFLCVSVSLMVFINASDWEGMAAVGEDLPETGFFMATDAFPVNTVVELINLENGKEVSIVVSSGLKNSAFLALLSRDAANKIDLKNQARIIMSQGDDQAAFSRYAESGGRIEKGELIIDLPDHVNPVTTPGPEYELHLVPDKPRPPQEKGPELDPSSIISSIVSAPNNPTPALNPVSIIPNIVKAPDNPPPNIPPDFIDPSLIIGPAREIAGTSPASGFSAPLINHLEKGKYYLQIAAYSKADAVESEIAKIDSKLPVAVMNAGSVEKPVYRVLIGPVNLGESGALLQRFKSSYNNAFLWLGK